MFWLFFGSFFYLIFIDSFFHNFVPWHLPHFNFFLPKMFFDPTYVDFFNITYLRMFHDGVVCVGRRRIYLLLGFVGSQVGRRVRISVYYHSIYKDSDGIFSRWTHSFMDPEKDPNSDWPPRQPVSCSKLLLVVMAGELYPACSSLGSFYTCIIVSVTNCVTSRCRGGMRLPAGEQGELVRGTSYVRRRYLLP